MYTGLISTFLSESGRTVLLIMLLKFSVIKEANMSWFSLRVAFDLVAFDSSKFLTSLIISVKVTFLNTNGVGKLHQTEFVFLLLVYLGSFQFFYCM